MRSIAVITAAGKGRRMGGDLPKPFLPLLRRPVLAHTLALFEKIKLVDEIIVVLPFRQIKTCREMIKRYRFKKVVKVVPGGNHRQDSVFEGLRAIDPPCDVVSIHDGVRPLVLEQNIEKSIRTAYRLGASVVAVPVTDTIKVATDDGFVEKTPDRTTLWAAATPQSFRYDVIMKAYEKAYAEDFYGTDDAMLVERTGRQVLLVEGCSENIKITRPEDLVTAGAILRHRKKVSAK